MYRLLAPLISSYGIKAELFVTKYNKTQDQKKWLPEWISSLKNEKQSLLCNLDFESASVIAFELSKLDKDYLNSIQVPWVNFEIHPIRFLDDLYFNIESSFDLDLSRLQIREEYIYLRVNLLRSRYGLHNKSTNSKLLIVGQTPFDKSIYFDDAFKRITDYFPALDNIVNLYNNIDYRPHPFLTDPDADAVLINRYSANECIDKDFYKLLLTGKYSAVCGISSSSLHEAPYFGLESIALEDRAKSFSKPISLSALFESPQIWLNDLLKSSLSFKKHSSLPPIPENYLRQIFSSWSYISKEAEVNDHLVKLEQLLAHTKSQSIKVELNNNSILNQITEIINSIQSHLQIANNHISQLQSAQLMHLQEINSLKDKVNLLQKNLSGD